MAVHCTCRHIQYTIYIQFGSRLLIRWNAFNALIENVLYRISAPYRQWWLWIISKRFDFIDSFQMRKLFPLRLAAAGHESMSNAYMNSGSLIANVLWSLCISNYPDCLLKKSKLSKIILVMLRWADKICMAKKNKQTSFFHSTVDVGGWMSAV